jgi:hypothetical protein
MVLRSNAEHQPSSKRAITSQPYAYLAMCSAGTPVSVSSITSRWQPQALPFEQLISDEGNSFISMLKDKGSHVNYH